jgi:hypothetical protein
VVLDLVLNPCLGFFDNKLANIFRNKKIFYLSNVNFGLQIIPLGLSGKPPAFRGAPSVLNILLIFENDDFQLK